MGWLHANGDEGIWPATIYAEGVTFPEPLPPLAGEATADLCVVGAGITGLSAALHAARAGMSVVLLEAQRVGWGASGRNGGQVGTGFNWSQRRLEAKLGAKTARDLWGLAEEAKADVRAAVGEAGWEAGVLSAARTARELAAMAAEAAWMAREYGSDVGVLDAADVFDAVGTRAYAGGVLDRSAGAVNPLAYALGLARDCVAAGVRVHEGSEVTRIAEGVVETASGRVRARRIVHATNGYGAGLTARTGARVLPINNYVAATERVPDRPKRTIWGNPAVADSQFVVNYFRWTGDGRLIYGGGESYGRRFPTDIRALVRANLARTYPDLADVEITHAWGGTLAVTATRLPWLSEVAPGVFAAGGYSGHGLALAGLFGKLCAEAARGERTRFDLAGTAAGAGAAGGAVARRVDGAGGDVGGGGAGSVSHSLGIQ